MTRLRRTALATLGITAIAAPAVAAAAAPAGTRHAHRFAGTPTVGALFTSATSHTHICTASVVASPGGNVLITAAHCLRGSVRGWSFAPAFRHGASPDGRWTITGAYLDAGWRARQDPRRDVAFLTVAPRMIDGGPTDIQSVTGANRLAAGARSGEAISVPAYPAGTDNDPVTCATRVYLHAGFPAFNCTPYVDGTSGSPWLHSTPDGRTVVGLIAGLHQGGCFPYTSYSPPLGAPARRAYRRAVAGGRPDIAPQAGSDHCSTGL
jgi:V8-like Glu-specific endopeptidase